MPNKISRSPWRILEYSLARQLAVVVVFMGNATGSDGGSGSGGGGDIASGGLK